MKKILVALILMSGMWLSTSIAQTQPKQTSPSPRPTKPVKALGWETNLDKGLAAARTSGKVLLVFFSSKTIPPCSAMKNEVLSVPKLRSAIAKMVEMVEIDVDDQPEIAGKYKVNAMPAFVILTPDGKEIDRFDGFLPAGAFYKTLQSACDPKQSIAELTRRINENENDMEARWLLAKKYARDKNREELDTMLLEMRGLDPKNEKGYLDRVAFLELMTSLNPKMPEEGYRATERFLQEFPNSAMADQVDLARAQMAFQMGNPQKSIEILEAFSEKHPDSKLAERVAKDLQIIKAKVQVAQ